MAATIRAAENIKIYKPKLILGISNLHQVDLKMNILFIVPTPGYGLKEPGKKLKRRIAGLFPSLGVALLATILKNAGHKCKVLDLQVNPCTPEMLLQEIKTFKPGAICLSLLTASAYGGFIIVDLIRKEEKDVPIICGGQHVSLFPEKTLLDNKGIDYVVFGEGEYKLLNLIDAIENNKPVNKVKGIYYRQGNKVLATENAPLIQNLDELPIPSREFFDMNKYIPVPNQYKRLPVTNLITSRGCTYRMCKFCNESGPLHTNYRRYSVERTIREIKYLINTYGVRDIYFWDDEFVFDKKWINDFCDALKVEKIDITWSCCAKVNYVAPEILKKMASVGCWVILYGIESGDQTLLNNIRKGQTLKQIRDAIKWTQDAGIEAKGSFMLGLPGETPELARKTIDFAIDLDLDFAIFCLTTPYPGTKLYDEFVGKDSIKDVDFSKYTSFAPIYLPEGYDNREQLIQLHKEAYRRFYLRLGYLKRRMKLLRTKDDFLKYITGVKYLIKSKVIKSTGL
ncbi:MAG: B12-binding domain-containing radical SAM protein [Nanoarchaeota archaeon]|nr:B12-binding domain-containing radical SAM protein [Nanoarchaeota archaeon]